ncbi:MAG: glycosyltransferase family 4 protein [Kiritimatiellae bacterium]|nr:glycosyltransferase family 4 protein [Kiritimatiellia bacterium]
MDKLKIAFCWTGLTGYMPSCWKALDGFENVEVRLYIEKPLASTQNQFKPDSLEGLSYRIRNREDVLNSREWINDILDFGPDLIEVTGWYGRLPRAVARSRALNAVPKILGLDHQYYKTLKQRVAPLVLKPYLHRFQGVAVPGERASAYAAHLGFDENKICRCLYGFDFNVFTEAGRARFQKNDWPRSFIFAGRYCSDKGIEVLLDAYHRYRDAVVDPWPLTFCGMGELASFLENEKGVSDVGFFPPERLPALFAQHGVFVLPSLHEPWGVVLGEACASGMPVITTSACGCSVELVQSGENGLVCLPGNPADLCRSMLWMHDNYELLPSMGCRSQDMARPFSAENWAVKWRDLAYQYKKRL